MINGNTLNYVASGLKMMRFPNKQVLKEEAATSAMANWFRRVDGRNDHRVSVLFNAYQETNLPPYIDRFIKDHVYDVHADSGGLQILSRKASIDAALKKKIYRMQGAHSDLAMGFDEIPAFSIANRSAIKDGSFKVFDRPRLESCARETGRNLKGQIETFIDMGVETKALAIIQGNDLETATIWCEEMFKEVPRELLERVQGIAIGSPCIGVGEVEEIEKLFWFTQLDLPIHNPQLHLLGVGALSRTLPLITFMRAGIIKDTIISYDNTTHTGMNTKGVYYFGLEPWSGSRARVTLSRTFVPEYEEVYHSVVSFCPEVTQWAPNVQEFFYLLTAPAKTILEERKTTSGMVMSMKAHAFGCMNNFMHHFSKCLVDDGVYDNIISTPERRLAYHHLEKIKTREDYYQWKSENARFLDSSPTRTQHNTLEDFFA